MRWHTTSFAGFEFALARRGRIVKIRSPVTAQVTPVPMYPIRFQSIFQYRLWGGRRLANVMGIPLPGEEPVGEAWVLSDRADHASRVANGSLEGLTLGQLLERYPEPLMGTPAGRFSRFPLLLKFLDVRQMLSVQVHPSDRDTRFLPAAETGKTEAWVVLEAGPDSRIYAGLNAGTTEQELRDGLETGRLTDHLASFTPKPGDAIFLPAGTVHSLGGDLVVFEIQQNSDVTFRLYDWNHVDPKTGKPRTLQVEQALACLDFADGPVAPVTAAADAGKPRRESLFRSDQFSVWRVRTGEPCTVGTTGAPRVLVCIDGAGQIESGGAAYAARRGDVFLLPAAIGPCAFRPTGTVTMLEAAIGKPDASKEGPTPCR